MTTFVGFDGFRGGWVSAWMVDNGTQGFDYSPTLERLLNYPHTRAMIDMPIGLPDQGHRACDREARQFLGASVFTGARRNLWNFEDQTKANEYYQTKNEPGISAQLWSIKNKIREIDDLMGPERQRTLRETHPELVFWRLNNRTPLLSKTVEEGRNQRIALLKAAGFIQIDRWLSHRWGTGIGRDDVIDACACAIAARDSKCKLPRDVVQIDSKGLLMEIWF